MFGAGGSRALPYVECAADGYQSASATCASTPEITGYPTWEIDGKFYSGMRTLQNLQQISGFDAAVKFPEYVPPPPPPRPPPPPGGFKAPAVEARSTPEQLALAQHLQSQGAKFYGAYWCGFCAKQRTMFGAEGTKALPYVECATDGYQSASAACASKPEVDGYPTWEINGKFYGGMRSLEDLAKLSGFTFSAKDVAIVGSASSSVTRGPGGCNLSDGGADCP